MKTNNALQEPHSGCVRRAMARHLKHCIALAVFLLLAAPAAAQDSDGSQKIDPSVRQLMRHLNEAHGIPQSVLVKAVSEGHAVTRSSDTTRPVFVNARVDRGDKVILRFSEPIFVHPLVRYVQQLFNDPLSLFLKAAVDVTIDGKEVLQSDNNSISGRNLTLDLTYPAARGDEVRVRYNNIFARNAGALLVDAAGNAVPLFSYQTVQNNIASGSEQSITAGPVLSPREITIAEGGSKKYTVALPYRPSENVTVRIYPFRTVRVSTRSLAFTPDNWSVPQEVTVSTYSDNNSIDAWGAVLHELVGDETAVWSFIRIVVNDRDAPLTVAGDTTISYSENDTSSVTAYSVAGDATVSWSVFGDDKGDFLVSSAGVLSFKTPPDYENPTDSNRDNVYRVTVHASNGSTTGALLNVMVSVTDVEEPPAAPAAPAVSGTAGSTTSLDVTWTEPDNTDGPAITNYDLQYRKGTRGGWTDGPQDVSGMRASIANLDANSTYQVQVRASNADGDGDWSQPGSGRTLNTAPVFPAGSTMRSLAETVGGAVVQSAGDVGAAVTATDADNDALAYSLEGSDSGKFAIEPGSGQIKTRVGERYDREARANYTVIVKAEDGNGGSDSITVTIAVTNAVERPPAPAAPAVSGTAGSTTSLDVNWTEPDNTGRPAITSYDLQYRKGTSGGWTDGPQDVSVTRASVANLDANSAYQVQVRASNADGDGDWSKPGSGRTLNTAPVFPAGSTMRSLAETVGGAVVQSAGDVGAAVTAADADNDTLAYSLEGSDSGKFAIEPGSGQIKTRVGESYDREARANYTVVVEAEDGNGGSDSITVTITVTNAVERPPAPAAPAVSGTAGSTTSLDVNWTEPDNTGRPAITSYDLQYRKGTSGGWTDGPQDVSGTRASIANLDANSAYQVQVRASNADGDGDWSKPGSGQTNSPLNSAPVFSAGSTTRSLAETVGGAVVQSAGDVGAAVTATDADNDALAYSLEGSDSGKFAIEPGSGQIKTRVGERYDREAKANYTVIVKAEDGNGGSDSITVTIAVTNAVERPPAPAAPAVSGTAGSTTSLDVNWTEPDNTGRPAITSYDLQYRKGTSGGWTDGPQDVSVTRASVANLDANSAYQVQVRASNADGDSDWSQPGSGSTPPMTLTDDEAPPVLSIADATAAEDAGPLTLPVKLSVQSVQEVMVTWSTADASAVAGADYTAASGDLTFAPGETEKTIAVAILDDELYEGEETFTVTLANPVNAALARAAASGTITADARPPVLGEARVKIGVLDLIYNEELDAGSAPAPASYLVRVDGTRRAVSSVAVSGTAVTLTLASGVAHGEAVTVSYVRPSLSPVQDPEGNPAAALTRLPQLDPFLT